MDLQDKTIQKYLENLAEQFNDNCKNLIIMQGKKELPNGDYQILSTSYIYLNELLGCYEENYKDSISFIKALLTQKCYEIEIFDKRNTFLADREILITYDVEENRKIRKQFKEENYDYINNYSIDDYNNAYITYSGNGK